MDWYIHYLLSLEILVTMDDGFWVSALERALGLPSKPDIFYTDQGAQYTGQAFTGVLKDHGLRINMDGKGGAMDNIMVGGLGCPVKYEDIYIKYYETLEALKKWLRSYFWFFNNERPHQSLGDLTPAEVYFENYQLREAA